VAEILKQGGKKGKKKKKKEPNQTRKRNPKSQLIPMNFYKLPGKNRSDLENLSKFYAVSRNGSLKTYTNPPRKKK
jgi:hypothetical protein